MAFAMSPTGGEVARAALSVVLATLLAARGRRKRALSGGGAIAAFVVGLLSVGSGLRFGAALLSFYYAGTRATRYGAGVKRRREDGYVHAAGNRGVAQVLASSAPGVALAVAYLVTHRHEAPLTSAAPARTALQLRVLLFFAACAGDTLASEVGSVAAARRPVLLLRPWRAVPPGTNGAVSAAGTLASAVGGVIVALGFCAAALGDAALLPTLVVGAVGGLVGSAIDSILGSVLQASWYDTESGKVLRDPPAVGSALRSRSVHIVGWDLLNGEAINCLAATLTCSLAPLFLRLYSYVDVVDGDGGGW